MISLSSTTATLARPVFATWRLSRCSGSQEWIKRDWAQVQQALRDQGRPDDDVDFGVCQFTHVVDTDDREKALAIQRPFFESVMGTHRSFEHLQECYLPGSVDDIVERLIDLKYAGLKYALVGPVSPAR